MSTKKDFYDSLPRRGQFTTERKAEKEIRELSKKVKVIKDKHGKKIDPFDLLDSMDVLSARSCYWEKNSSYMDYKEGFLPVKEKE